MSRNRVERLTDERVAQVVLRLLNEPMRLIELREALRKRGVLISYTRLKKVMDYLVEKGYVACFKYGKAIMYIKKEIVN